MIYLGPIEWLLYLRFELKKRVILLFLLFKLMLLIGEICWNGAHFILKIMVWPFRTDPIAKMRLSLFHSQKKFSEVFRNHDTFLAPHGHFKVFVVNESLVDSSEIWSEEPCWHLVKNCQTANTMTHLTAFKPKHILCGAKFDDFCNMEILRGAVFDELFPYS